MPIYQGRWPQIKNARKQTCFKIQFCTGMEVTSDQFSVILSFQTKFTKPYSGLMFILKPTLLNNVSLLRCNDILLFRVVKTQHCCDNFWHFSKLLTIFNNFWQCWPFLSDPGFLGSDLWVRFSQTDWLSIPCADLTDVTLADEDTNPILTDNAKRTFHGNVAMQVTQPGEKICN